MVERLPLGSVDEYLARVVLDRMRIGLPLVIIGVLGALFVSEPAGVPITSLVIIVNIFTLTLGTATYIAALRNRIPLRLAHAVAAAAWMLAPMNTLVSMLVTHQPNLVFPLFIELALACVFQVNPRWLFASTAVIIVLWVPLCVRDAGDNTVIELTSVVSLGLCAWITGFRLSQAMVRAYEDRLESERLRDQFVHAQRMEAVGTLASGLAHDMNNILAGILGVAELAWEDATDEAQKGELKSIVTSAERGAELTRSLLAYARHGQYQRREIGVEKIIDEVEPLLARMLGKGVVLERRGGTDAVIDGDPAQLGQAVVNLCINGADAMEHRGTLTIGSHIVELANGEAQNLGLPAGRYAMISVSDTGRGMDDAVRQRIFEPFFTTKPVGKGTGLGLAMVFGTVKGHGGAIDVASQPMQGTTFRMFLPASAAASVAEIASVRDTGKIRVASQVALVVDDEPRIRANVTRTLRQMGLSVLGASDGAEALEVFEARREEIALVVLDMAMPVMGGAECFRKLREASRVPILLSSGFADDEEVQQLLASGATSFLEKPYRTEALREHVLAMLERRPVSSSSSLS